MNEINLLPRTKNDSQKQERVVSLLRKISLGFLFITACIAIGMFLLVLSSPLSTVQQTENELLITMDQSKEKISKNVIINERLISIGRILKERNSYDTYTGVVLSNLPASVTISSLDIDQESMQVVGTSVSLESINTYFTALITQQEKKELISSVVLQSLSSQNENGVYTFTLQITFL